jgi:hypothetical protein
MNTLAFLHMMEKRPFILVSKAFATTYKRFMMGQFFLAGGYILKDWQQPGRRAEGPGSPAAWDLAGSRW